MLNTAHMISMHWEELYSHKKSLSLKMAKLLLSMYFPKAKISAKIYCLSSTEVKFHLEDHIKGPSRWPGSTLAQQNSYPGLHPPHHRTCVPQMSRENAFSADLLMRLIQVRDNWVTWHLYCPVNTFWHVCPAQFSLDSSSLRWKMQHKITLLATRTHKHTHSCLLPVPSLGDAAVVVCVHRPVLWSVLHQQISVSVQNPAERTGCPCRSQRPLQLCLDF